MVEDSYKHQGQFTCRPYRSKRLAEYFKRMSQDHTKVEYDDNVADVLKAQGYHVEEAPRSVYKADKLYEALSGYAPNTIPAPKPTDEYRSGISLAYSCFAKPKGQEPLHVLSMTPETIVRITSNPSGSAGLTNYGCTKAESQTRALERGLQTLKREKQPEPCLAFSRTQFNDKTRLVWGYPYSMTVIEGLVAYVLLQEFKGGRTPMAFAMSTGALGTKLRVASYHKEWAYSLDMSQFDATISAELIHIAFKILRTWYDMSEVETVSQCTVGQIFDLIEYYFIHTTIVMPNGKIYIGKDHGVPSGSYFTQIVDSIVNVIIGGTIAAKYHLNVSKREIFVLGDDLLMWSNRKMDLDTIAAYANSAFGVKLHGSEKSRLFHYTEAIHYLGRDWENGVPDLDQDEILKRMIYPERFRQYPKDPEERKRAVRMLLLAYAGTYRRAWRIAYLAMEPNDMWYAQDGNRIDANTYYRDHQVVDADPDHLSGLMRYIRKYHTPKTRGDIPVTAIQFWV